jgi:hypothetical protein
MIIYDVQKNQRANYDVGTNSCCLASSYLEQKKFEFL